MGDTYKKFNTLLSICPNTYYLTPSPVQSKQNCTQHHHTTLPCSIHLVLHCRKTSFLSTRPIYSLPLGQLIYQQNLLLQLKIKQNFSNMETINCLCHQVDNECYTNGCQNCHPSCPICDEKLAHENKLLRAEIKELENSTSKNSKEVLALADDLVAQEKLCENMEQELAKLLQKERRGRRARRTTMAKK